MSCPTVVLKPRRALPFFSRHPWVFAGAIQPAAGNIPAGTEVVVRDDVDRFVARGVFNPHSNIAVRLYSWNETQGLDEALWSQRIDDAISLRRLLFPVIFRRSRLPTGFQRGGRLIGLDRGPLRRLVVTATDELCARLAEGNADWVIAGKAATSRDLAAHRKGDPRRRRTGTGRWFAVGRGASTSSHYPRKWSSIRDRRCRGPEDGVLPGPARQSSPRRRLCPWPASSGCLLVHGRICLELPGQWRGEQKSWPSTCPNRR